MNDLPVSDGQPKAGDVVGYCDCPICFSMGKETVAAVLLSKRGKFYFKCPIHDVQLMTNNNCQQWLHENKRDTPQRTTARKPAEAKAAAAVVVDLALADPAAPAAPKKKPFDLSDSLKGW